MFDSIGGDDAAFSAAALERYRGAFARPGAARAAVNYYRAAFRQGLDRLASGGVGDRRVEVPTLVLWGMRDAALSPALLDGLDDLVSDLDLERFPEAGHWLQLEEPERVTQDLRSFF